MIASDRHQAPFLVEAFNLDQDDIFAISIDLRAIRAEPDGNRRPRRLPFVGYDYFAPPAAARFNGAGLVADLPLHVPKLRHLLAAKALSVQEELNFLKVR